MAEPNVQNCPFCGGSMKKGYLYAAASRAAYWLPEEGTYQGAILTEAGVNKSGGFVLGTVAKPGFLAKTRPCSLYCEKCKCLITVLE
jgi:hypothetical protein